MRGNAQCSSSTHDGEHREYYGTSKEQRKNINTTVSTALKVLRPVSIIA
jgi:hypothetical protein